VATVTRTLRSQLADLGYRPSDITYLRSRTRTSTTTRERQSVSRDRPGWRDRRTGVHVGGRQHPINRTFFDSIKTSKSIDLDRDEYDVFGDGAVIIKAAPGHSPGIRCWCCVWPTPDA
jgi:hypothetical protein